MTETDRERCLESTHDRDGPRCDGPSIDVFETVCQSVKIAHPSINAAADKEQYEEIPSFSAKNAFR